ncbi:MAG: hypothetical protein FJW36_14210 [Acidobacteria bacterium]|nr:hypothetical protein [Acidobacteriota bacterium]
MQGTWGFHRSSTGHLLTETRGSFSTVWFPALGIGDTLVFHNQKGKPLLMLNAGGTESSHGNRFIFGPAGKRGVRVKGYSNIPNLDFEKVWFGFGFKWGGHLAVGGSEFMIGGLTNAGNGKTTVIQTQNFKARPGLGGSYTLVGILALGYPTAQAMNGATNDGFDFALSFGKKWDGILKSLENTPDYVKLVNNLPRVLNRIEMIEDIVDRLKKIENVASWAKILATFSGIPASDSSFSIFDIPGAGDGLEIGVSFGVTTISSVDGIDAPSWPTPPVHKISKPTAEPRPYTGLGRRNF